MEKEIKMGYSFNFQKYKENNYLIFTLNGYCSYAELNLKLIFKEK